MMKKIAIAVLLSVITVPALAANGNAYVGARAGQAKTNIDNAILTKDSPTAWGIFAGYAFTPMVGLEVEYLDLGKVTGIGGGAESRGYSVSGVGSFPIGEQFSLLGKVGYAMISTKDISSVPEPDAESDAITYGLGGQFNFSPVVGVRVNWDRYNIDDSAQNLKGNVRLLSVGGVFKF